MTIEFKIYAPPKTYMNLRNPTLMIEALFVFMYPFTQANGIIAMFRPIIRRAKAYQ